MFIIKWKYWFKSVIRGIASLSPAKLGFARNDNQKGISILEVIVAVMIIALGMIGVLSLVIQNVEAQYINKNVLIASGLAQEGLELARNIRDKNWLNEGSEWDESLTAASGARKFVLDYLGNMSEVSGLDDSGTNLTIDSYGFYWRGAGTATKFKRMLTVEKITIAGQDYYLDVKRAIRWSEGLQNDD